MHAASNARNKHELKRNNDFVEEWAVLHCRLGMTGGAKGMLRENIVVSDRLIDAGGHHGFSQRSGARTQRLDSRYSCSQKTICGKHTERLFGGKCIRLSGCYCDTPRRNLQSYDSSIQMTPTRGSCSNHGMGEYFPFVLAQKTVPVFAQLTFKHPYRLTDADLTC